MKWLVDVSGYDTVEIVADSSRKARYRAFLAFREAFGHGHTFRDFLARGVNVSKAVA